LVNMTLNTSWLGKEVIADHCDVVRHFDLGGAASIRSAKFTTGPNFAKSSHRIASQVLNQ
jgi:hypothetical protein